MVLNGKSRFLELYGVIKLHQILLVQDVSNAEIEESDEEKPGIILDYDKVGNIIGIEIIVYTSDRIAICL